MANNCFISDFQTLSESVCSKLRDSNELWDLFFYYLSIHWRLRQFSIKPEIIDFVDFAKKCKWTDVPIERIPIKNNDLAINGKNLNEIDQMLFRECLSIVRERHHAAIWLIGEEEIYSEVTCDT